MSNALWPPTLPQFVLADGYSRKVARTGVQTQFDVGPPQSRRRVTKSYEPIEAQIFCTAAQKVIFDDFFTNSVAGGTLPFDWVHPETQAPATFTFDIMQGLPTVRTPDSVNYIITFKLMLMP